MFCISFEVMETGDLDARVFGTGGCSACRETTPRANIFHFLKLYIVYQQYCMVLGRFCGERVTGWALVDVLRTCAIANGVCAAGDVNIRIPAHKGQP